jgi:hypothetical protein
MGQSLLKANKRPLNVTVEAQVDLANILGADLLECFQIWKTVTGKKSRLNILEFDEVFGLMLGDAEAHFEIVSHGMLSSGDFEQEAKCDALSIFLSLSAVAKDDHQKNLKKSTIMLNKMANMFFFYSESDAPDYGMSLLHLNKFMDLIISGLCRLTGRPQPEDNIIKTVAGEIYAEAKKSDSLKVTRKHVIDWLLGSKEALFFYETCLDEILGQGFDEFSGEILSSALFEANKKTKDVGDIIKSFDRGVLWSTRIKTFLTSKSWTATNILDSEATCSEALRFLQKNRLPFARVYLETEKREIQNIEMLLAEEDVDKPGPPRLQSPCPYPQIVGIVDYQKLIVSFLAVFSLYKVPLPSEVSRDNTNPEKAEKKKEMMNTIAKTIVSLGKVWGHIKVKDILAASPRGSEIDMMPRSTISRSWSEDTNENSQDQLNFADVVEEKKICSAVERTCEPFVQILVGQPLAQLLEIFSHPKIHSVTIIADVANPMSTITSLGKVEALRKLMEYGKDVFGDIVFANLRDLGLIEPNFISISPETTTLVAFHQLALKTDSGIVAIVDSNNVLVSYLRTSDFSRLTKHQVDDSAQPEVGELLLPTLEFHEVHKALTAFPDMLMKDVIDNFLRHKCTSILVVDDDCKPVGTVNISTIFKLALKMHENTFLYCDGMVSVT